MSFSSKHADPKFRTGGKPSTWFPPGGLVEHISDDQFLYKISIAF